MAGVTLTEALPRASSISKNGFRPWWETMRSYCLNALLAIDFMIYYITYNFSSADCIPYSEEMSTLSVDLTKFVNSLCFRQVDGVYRYAGPITLIGCMVLYIAYSWWEVIPKVGDRFSTVKKVDKSMHQNHLVKSEVKKLVAPPDEDETKERETLVIDMFRQLFLRKTKMCHLFCLYQVRNLIAGVFVAAFAVAVAQCLKAPLKVDDNVETTFNCSLSKKTATSVGLTEFLCSNPLQSQLQLYFIAIFYILIGIEVITVSAFVVSFKVMLSTKESKNLSEYGRFLNMDYAFVLFFARHSSPVHDSTEEMLSLLNDDFELEKVLKAEFFEEDGIDEERISWCLHLRKDLNKYVKELCELMEKSIKVLEPQQKPDVQYRDYERGLNLCNNIRTFQQLFKDIRNKSCDPNGKFTEQEKKLSKIIENVKTKLCNASEQSSLFGSTSDAIASLSQDDSTTSSSEVKEVRKEERRTVTFMDKGSLTVLEYMFTTIYVKADGSCFFHAVKNQRGLNESSESIRNRACDEIQKEEDFYLGHIPQNERQGYISRLRQNSEYADEPLIAATAKVLECCIFIVKVDDNEPALCCHGKSFADKCQIYLALQKQHYWSLWPKPSSSPNFLAKMEKNIVLPLTDLKVSNLDEKAFREQEQLSQKRTQIDKEASESIIQNHSSSDVEDKHTSCSSQKDSCNDQLPNPGESDSGQLRERNQNHISIEMEKGENGPTTE